MVAGGRYTLDPRYRRFPTIVHALDDGANRQPDRPAIIVPASDRTDRMLTYRQYRSAVAGMARHFQALDARGRTVAVCMGNGMEAAVACFGGMAANALTVPMNPNYTPAELEPLLADVAPHVLCCDPQQEERLRGLAAK
ncbi:MAG: acyl--CoA ligase, partial [Rhodospirillaceae bacterium]|nr:acyl--CoA ligase [Rhodospirillaceae bacterium]